MPASWALLSERSPCSPGTTPGVNPKGGGGGIFFIAEIYLTTFVVRFCSFDQLLVGPHGCTRGAPQAPPPGGWRDPMVIFFITEAYALTFISKLC